MPFSDSTKKLKKIKNDFNKKVNRRLMHDTVRSQRLKGHDVTGQILESHKVAKNMICRGSRKNVIISKHSRVRMVPWRINSQEELHNGRAMYRVGKHKKEQECNYWRMDNNWGRAL